MICVVIKGPTFEEVNRQISKAMEHADLVELRLDCFEKLDMTELKKLRALFTLPMIFTLRSVSQGGHFLQTEEMRLSAIHRLAALNPEYLDLEYDVNSHFVLDISAQYPAIKLIRSYHNDERTPEDLDRIYLDMQKIPAYYYKIAVTARNSLDVMRFMCWRKTKDDKLIAISMGSHGQVSRILGPLLGCPITFTALDENQQTAPGQLSAKTLINQYRYCSLSPQTALYGLIGDPIVQSISEITHNHLLNTCGLEAVYVKIRVHPSELGDFLQYARHFPFRGLSVTIPLKEQILSYLDEITPQALDIGAVNTLLFDKGKICGSNTDGIGALNALEKECLVRNKRIVLIGAGGSSKAIAYEAIRRGGLVTIINRDAERALKMTERLHCRSMGLDRMAECAKEGYDILINSTPASLPIDPKFILPQTIVMDITTKPKDTEFLKLAAERKCRIIYGYRMFVEQALGQFHVWFKDRIEIEKCRQILEKKALESIS